MERENDSRKQFEEYLKAKEGQPIDPQAEANAKRELELGEKGGFAVYGDEPSKAEKFKNAPEGELFKTELTEPELEQKIQDLSVARAVIVNFLEDPTIDNADINRETSLFDLEEMAMGKDGSLEIAVSDLAKHGFDGSTKLFDLPEAIKNEVDKDTIILNHIRRKASL